jgi:hypothetical protein
MIIKPAQHKAYLIGMAVFLSLMPSHFRGKARCLSLRRTVYSFNEYIDVSRLQCFQPDVLVA